jgi:hypothetical protein
MRLLPPKLLLILEMVALTTLSYSEEKRNPLLQADLKPTLNVLVNCGRSAGLPTLMISTSLLQHTAWNIGDIACALGFEYPTYFNNYFKRMTGTNPKSLRAL